LVARRALIKKPPVQSILGKLDRKRTQNRKVIERELTKTVGALAQDAPGRKPPTGELVPILEFVQKAGRPVVVSEVASGTGIPVMTVHAGLLRLVLDRWVARLPGERYRVSSGQEALGLEYG
jgi:predicted Rossmann fold nucleotide-binding protein DprA/Smf involved in DNA uptake